MDLEVLKKDLKLSQLQNLVNSGGFKFTEQANKPWFDYTSNWIGPYYVQSMDVFKREVDRNIAINSMKMYIDYFIDEAVAKIISSGETRDWPFGFILADRLKSDMKMLYKDGSSFGIPDIQLQGKTILHVADLNNEGTSVKKWSTMIQKAGAQITDILFYVDRMEDGVDVCKELGINRHAIIELDEEAWQYLLERNYISPKMYQELVEYWKDRKAWGCKKILEFPDPLVDLIRNEKKRDRGIGIFNNYNQLTNSELAKKLDVNDVGELLHNE